MKKKIIAIIIGISVLATGYVCVQEYQSHTAVCYYGCPNSKRIDKLNLKKGVKKL